MATKHVKSRCSHDIAEKPPNIVAKSLGMQASTFDGMDPFGNVTLKTTLHLHIFLNVVMP